MTSKWSADERERYITAAQGGDAAAQMWLGWAYWEGKFIDADLQASRKWLERAASSGLAETKYRLAILHYHAFGEVGKFIDLLQEATQDGCAAAAYELGNAYYSGLVVAQDRVGAVSLWRGAARAGHILSEIQLIKAELHEADLLRKPVVWFKLVPMVARVARRFWKDPNDPSILGAPV